MSSDVLVEVQHLSKKFRRGESYDSLRDLIPGLVRRLGFSRGQSQPTDRWFWALRDVSFQVRRGEVLGIIGANGAGKSTLLKILARILRPTEGYVRVNGRLRALIEVAAGFHPDLTGRENIFLNGAILGMRMAEIKARFDEIVEFAGIGPFLDTPVKRYSSGMFARLGFAVAAHLEPDILLVDEVLAVGDAAFQAKCLGKMQHVAGQGRTVIFVSHNMRAVMQLCDRVILLEHGQITQEGPAEQVVDAYLRQSLAQYQSWVCELPGLPDAPFEVHRLRLVTEDGRPAPVVPRSQPIVIEITGEVRAADRRLIVAIDIKTIDDLTLFRTHSFEQDQSYAILGRPGPFCLSCRIPAELLPAGKYNVGLVLAERGVREFFHHRQVLQFEVYQDRPIRGSDIMSTVGLVTPSCDWTRID
ncbi:MAG TPA: ABC transporter ATP-binding protein [Thermogutta sp.]|nr:ABC transporter ATP-binding protein [Thermogutta sp.]HQF13942.1 ABC transporter ATP-binding protein [Thermogutta sp.]